MTKDNRVASKSCGAIFAVTVVGAHAMTKYRFRRSNVNRWVLRFLLLPLAATPMAAQTIAFHAVPPNATVQCLNTAPATLLAVTGAIPFGIVGTLFTNLSTGSIFTINNLEI